MTTPTLTTLGHGPAHTNRAAVAQLNRELGERNYADAADARIVLLNHLRSHGDITRACAAASVDVSTFYKWQRTHADLDASVRNAIAFAESGELSYAAWEAGR